MKKSDLKKFRLFREKYDQIVPIGEWCGTALWILWGHTPQTARQLTIFALGKR